MCDEYTHTETSLAKPFLGFAHTFHTSNEAAHWKVPAEGILRATCVLGLFLILLVTRVRGTWKGCLATGLRGFSPAYSLGDHSPPGKHCP